MNKPDEILKEREEMIERIPKQGSQKEIHNWTYNYIDLVREEIEARYGKRRDLDK